MTMRAGKLLLASLLPSVFVASFVSSKSQTKPQSAQPIRLHPANPHYFLFRGKATALITSGEHYGAVLNADVDFHKYLVTIDSDGLNYTRIFGGSYIEVPAKSFGILRNDLAPQPDRFIAPWVRSEIPGYAGGGNKLDLAKWNPEYFERYRAFLADASKCGIVVEITLFSSHYDEAMWKISPFNPSNNVNNTTEIEWKKLNTLENGNILGFQEKYARKLIDEARDFDNVIFEIQNEPWSDRPTLTDVVNPYLRPPGRDTYPNSVDIADELSLAWQARVAEWITQEEAPPSGHHLIAQNYSNFRASIRQLNPGVDVVNFHYAYPDAVSLNYGLGKAIAYDETGFLGRGDDAYRRQAWNFMLSGGSIFDALDYSFSPGHEDGKDLEPNGPGGGSPSFRHELRILSDFLKRFSILDLRPDAASVKHASGVVAHALSNPGREYAIYLDGAGPTELTLTLPSGDYHAEWLNTKTGATDNTEDFHHAGGEKPLTSPAFENGIAFRLTRAAK
ncbi:MAG TPA: hypothetical protein VMP12_07045 [Candidatus Sulfotelmatobacter sp.]|nr:hypothetical protein [Candidatus Sulfotelmatobacter sp.]